MPLSRNLTKLCLIIFLGIATTSILVPAWAKPQGGQVEDGDITITSDSGNAIDTLITQQSQKGIINWQSFDIGETEHTHFAQPSASAITLNRIFGGSASSILGRLTATGQIFLINPAGILFGSTARVDVAGLLATTANISNEDFLSGNYYFIQGPGEGAKVINQGYIEVAENGLVFLTAPVVENTGLIEAKIGGKIVLASTPDDSAYVLDFYGDQLLQFVVPSDIESDIDTAVLQSGQIIAPGGTVLLAAGTAKSVVDKAINMSGIIEADTISNVGGQIILSGGKKGIVSVTGKISARGKKAGEKGGKVKITGEKVGLFAGSTIDVSGAAGGGEALIGANRLDGNIISAANYVYVDPLASIYADATVSGKGGDTIVWSDEATRFYGSAFARGGPLGGDGGFIETSTKKWLDVYGATIDVTAPAGDTGLWLLDPFDIFIVAGTPPSTGGAWSGGAPNIWSSVSAGSQLYASDITSKLGAANVTIQTGGTGGNIFLQDPLITPAGLSRNLKLIAHNDIEINAALTGNGLYLFLETQSVTGEIKIAAPIYVTNFETGALGETHFYSGGSVTTDSTYLPGSLFFGFQDYHNPIILQPGASFSINSPDAGSFVNFFDTINGAGTLNIINVLGVNFEDNIGATDALTSLDVDASVIEFDTPGTALSVTTTGQQNYETSGFRIYDNVTLTSTNASTGNINLTGTTIGPGDLIINAAKDVTLAGEIGTVANPIGNLDITGSSISLDTPTIRTTGNQEYNADVNLLSDATLITTGIFPTPGGDVSFYGDVFGPVFGSGGLTIDSDSDVRFDVPTGLTNPISYLDITVGTGNTLFLPDFLGTGGTQTYRISGNIVGTTPQLVTQDPGGNIRFTQPINSAIDLTLYAQAPFSEIIFEGALGNITPLQALWITNGETTLPNLVKTVGVQSYGGHVKGKGFITLETTSPGSGDIRLENTVDSLSALPGDVLSLIIDAQGDVSFSDTVGGTYPLGVLSVVGNVISFPNTTSVTSVSQGYYAPVNISGNITLTTTSSSINFQDVISGPGSLTLNSSGDIIFPAEVGTVPSPLSYLTINSGNVTFPFSTNIRTTGDQTYNVPIDTSGSVALTTGPGGDVIFGSTIDGSLILSINSQGDINFSSAVGATTALDFLAINSGNILAFPSLIRTSGAQLYSAPINVAPGTTTLETTGIAGGNLTFGSTIDGSLGLTINTSRSVSFGGTVGATTPLSYLTINDNSGIAEIVSLPLSITTTGTQSYNVPITASGVTTLTTTSGGNIELTNTVIGNLGLTLDAQGDVTLGDSIGSLFPTEILDYFIIAAADNINLNTPQIVTAGHQTYNAPIDLGANTSLITTTGTGEILFTDTINGNFGITIDAQGNVTFNDLIGNTTPLSYLDVTVTGAGIILNTPQVMTAGYQNYQAPITLESDITFTSTAGDITFGDTMDSDSTQRSLAINTPGTTTFGGAVGSTEPLTTITTDSGGTTKISGGSITTSGAQQYFDNVILGADTTLEASEIIFHGALDSDPTPRSLNFDIPGDITFNSPVGSINALSQLTTTNASGNIYLAGGSVTTTGLQEYQKPIFLQNNTSLTGGSITFNNTIDSFDIIPRDLTINSLGTITFNEVVGFTNPLLNLNTTSIGTTILNAPSSYPTPPPSDPINPALPPTTSIRTEGSQTYNGEVVLQTNSYLSAEGDIVFGSNVITTDFSATGPELYLNSDTGDILFQADVGTLSEPITTIRIFNAHNVTADASIYTRIFVQQAGTGITRFGDVAAIPSPIIASIAGANQLYVGLPGGPAGTGLAAVVTDRVEGTINVGTMYIGTNSAELYGLVDGHEDVMALLNFILPKLPDNYDLYTFNTLEISLRAFIDDTIMQAILLMLFANYAYGFGYQFYSLGSEEFDYLLLIDPLACEIAET